MLQRPPIVDDRQIPCVSLNGRMIHRDPRQAAAKSASFPRSNTAARMSEVVYRNKMRRSAPILSARTPSPRR